MSSEQPARASYGYSHNLSYRYHYRCVIYGRDEDCKLSKDWQRQMGVSREAAKKPFYNVLVEDGSNRYAAQGIPINWVK